MIEPTITFFVEGVPKPKQSFRAVRNGRHITGFTPARIKAWQADVGWAAQLRMRALGVDPLEGAITVELTFFLKDARRQDGDNLSKAILDSLNKIAWVDDKQAIDLLIHKYICRGRQGVLVQISENDREQEITQAEMEHILYRHAPGWAVIEAA